MDRLQNDAYSTEESADVLENISAREKNSRKEETCLYGFYLCVCACLQTDAFERFYYMKLYCTVCVGGGGGIFTI
jgi:hypothetical protein